MSDDKILYNLFKKGLGQETSVMWGKVVCIYTNVHVVKKFQTL